MLPSNEKNKKNDENKENCIFKRKQKPTKIWKNHTRYTGLCDVIGVDLKNNFNASTKLFLLATYIDNMIMLNKIIDDIVASVFVSMVWCNDLRVSSSIS